MAVDVIMPQMGESIFEGTITKWLKKPGDRIERDEPLFEISTDKVDAEIPAPSAGVLKEIKVTEGQTVPIQTVVAVIEAVGASAGAPTAAPAPSPVQAATPAPSPQRTETSKAVAPAPPAPAASPAARPAAGAAPSGRGHGKEIRSSPLVRRLAKENQVDLAGIEGSGAGGRISKKDILAAMESASARSSAPATASAPSTAGPSAASSGSPTVPPGPGGAMAHPALENAVPRERIYFGGYEAQPMSAMRQRIAEHMVAAKRVSPHVYSIDEADMTRIARIRERSKGAFEAKYGTKLTYMPFFVRACVEGLRAYPTVNASADGTTMVLHREINLGIGVIQKRPMVIDDAIAVRSMVYLTLSYDHRVVDGAIAHQFVGKVKSYLEGWNEEIL